MRLHLDTGGGVAMTCGNAKQQWGGVVLNNSGEGQCKTTVGRGNDDMRQR